MLPHSPLCNEEWTKYSTRFCRQRKEVCEALEWNAYKRCWEPFVWNWCLQKILTFKVIGYLIRPENPNIKVKEGRNSLRIVGDFVVVFCFLFIFFADNKMSISEIPHQNMMFLFVQFQEFFICEQNLNLTKQPRKPIVMSVLNYSPFYFQCKRNFENKNRTSQTKCYLKWAVMPKLADKQSMLTIKDSLPSRWEVDH